MRHHTPIFSNYAKHIFNGNGHHYTKEVIFFEWFETPVNYETSKKRRHRKEEEARREALQHPKPTGPMAQAIMIGLIGACVIGLFVLGFLF